MKPIEIKNLTKRYKELVAVDKLNLSVEKENFCNFSVNGAGRLQR